MYLCLISLQAVLLNFSFFDFICYNYWFCILLFIGDTKYSTLKSGFQVTKSISNAKTSHLVIIHLLNVFLSTILLLPWLLLLLSFTIIVACQIYFFIKDDFIWFANLLTLYLKDFSALSFCNCIFYLIISLCSVLYFTTLI